MRVQLVAALGLATSCGGARAPVIREPTVAVTRELEAAESAERARQHEEARRHYERAVAAAGADGPGRALAHREFGETLASWGELPAAAHQLEAAVAARPDDASAWHDLGILRHAAGDLAGATAALQQARSLAPTDPRPRIALAALYWRTGNRAAASAEYTALLALDLPVHVRAKVRWALQTLAKP